jgi:aryl-alcohol dehydrogenase-like predicted oxidoreductase
MNERGFAILKTVDQVAAAHNATPAQVSLAWLMAQPAVTAPIASATTPQQVAELIPAVELKLTNEELEILTNAGK